MQDEIEDVEGLTIDDVVSKLDPAYQRLYELLGKAVEAWFAEGLTERVDVLQFGFVGVLFNERIGMTVEAARELAARQN